MNAFITKQTIKVAGMLQDERGETDILSVILVLVIVVGLVVTFRTNLYDFATALWGKITSGASGS